MNFFKKLLNTNNADGTRESMKTSYNKHFRAAQKEGTLTSKDTTPHLAGLYGALATRYVTAGIPRLEVVLWDELAPFILMSEKDSVEALAEYVVCVEDTKDRQKEAWLKNLINIALRKINTADENYKAMACSAIMQSDIYWLNLLEPDVVQLLREEQEKLY